MMWNSGWGGLGMLLNWVFMFAFLAGLIAFGVWVYRALTRPSAPSYQSPLDVAKARYARGEISREQYEQLRKDLGG